MTANGYKHSHTRRTTNNKDWIENAFFQIKSIRLNLSKIEDKNPSVQFLNKKLDQLIFISYFNF